jgi:hypothetical protein
MQRMQDMATLGATRQGIAASQEGVMASQMNRENMAREWQKQQQEYETANKMLNDIGIAVQKNTQPDGSINYDGFTRDLYPINPELAIKVQDSIQKKSGGLLQAAISQKQKMLDDKIASLPEGEEKKWYQDNYYMLIAAPSAVFPISEQGISGAVQKATAVERAKQPIDVETAVQKTAAVGKEEAKTPAFISSEQVKWSSITTPYKEIVKNYGFGNSAAKGAIGQVALVKALEKVREPSSAVMFGDAEIYRKAGGFWDKVVEDGFVDATSATLKKTLPPEYEKSLRILLDEAMEQSTANIIRDRENRIDVAVNDYGWPQERAERIYRIPITPAKKGKTETDSPMKNKEQRAADKILNEIQNRRKAKGGK